MAVTGGILIVDDHVVLSQALARALGLEGFEPVRYAEDLGLHAVMARAEELRPDLVLLDLYLGDDELGTPLIAPLRRMGINVLVLTASEDPVLRGEALRAGALGVLAKSLPFHDLTDAIRLALTGGPVMSSDERDRLVDEYDRARSMGDERLRLGRLSRREQQILAGLIDGQAPKEIAVNLGVAVPTVRTQVRSLFAKLEVNSQRAAVALALKAGWSFGDRTGRQ